MKLPEYKPSAARHTQDGRVVFALTGDWAMEVRKQMAVEKCSAIDLAKRAFIAYAEKLTGEQRAAQVRADQRK